VRFGEVSVIRRLVRFLSFISFSLSVLLCAVQGALVLADVVLFLLGKEPIFFIVAGVGAQGGFSVGLTLWLYFSFTAYSAFWFVAGMGLKTLAAPPRP